MNRIYTDEHKPKEAEFINKTNTFGYMSQSAHCFIVCLKS